MKLKDVKDFLLWLSLTKHCPYCDKLIKRDEDVCENCKDNLPRITEEICKFCGAEKKRCGCKKHRMGYDGITSPFYYESGIKDCIHNFKFNGRNYLGSILAENMCRKVKTDFKDVNFDFICYVPFTKMQKLRRSYNPSEILAEKLSSELHIPLKNVLVKLFDTGTQHSMRVKNRSGNVFGIYDVDEIADVQGKTILLVDDIKTTGATLNECAWILKIRGAENVYCVTAALTGKEKHINSE